MTYAAQVAIAADRYTPCVRTVTFRGLDLTGVALRMQVRQNGDTPGVPMVDLQNVASAQAEGIKLVSVDVVDGYPTSVVQIRINETTIKDPTRFPFVGELGDASPFVYDLIGTLGGDKRVLMAGAFTVSAGVTGADNAPMNRPFGYGRHESANGMRGGATLTFGETRVDVTIDGSALMGPLVAAAERARDAVKPTYGNGPPSANAGIAGSWYRDMTDPFSPLEWFKTSTGWQGPQSLRGNPGGNVMAIGLFQEASSLIIPPGADMVRTKGHTFTGLGVADYIYDPAVDSDEVAAFPRACFLSANGRGFRIARSSISVRSFGARGDGNADDSVPAQAAYDYRAAKGLGGGLVFEDGTYRVALTLSVRGIDICGASRSGTVLRPVGDSGTILRAVFRDGAWSAITVRDLSLKGGPDLKGIGFECGNPAAPAADDDLTVGVAFERVEFVDLDKCVSRPFGNIGMTFTDCNFSTANYHIHAISQSYRMHVGCMIVRGGEMQAAQKASIYLNGNESAGGGQIVFDTVIMQANAGYVLYMRNFRGSEAVPAVVFRSCWNEVNSERALEGFKLSSVEIDGVSSAPVYADLGNVTLVRFEDTPIGAVRSVNSATIVADSALDHCVPYIDINSLFTPIRARCFNTPLAARVQSIGTVAQGSAYAPWWWMSHPTHRTKAYAPTTLLAKDCATPFLLFSNKANQDTVALPGEAVLPGVDTVQQITLTAGQYLYLPPVALPRGAWIAWTVTCRLMTGTKPTMTVTGSASITLEQPIDHDEWRTYRGLRDNENALASQSIRISAALESGCQVALGGLALMAFNSRQDALDWVNGGSFPG